MLEINKQRLIAHGFGDVDDRYVGRNLGAKRCTDFVLNALLGMLFGEAMAVAEMGPILVEFFAIWILAIVDLLSLNSLAP